MVSPVISLLAANLITIVFAIAGDWDAAPIIFIYWVQSAIIGVFTVITILGADPTAIKADMDARHKERGDNITIDLSRVRGHLYLLGAMFAVHYGLFHVAYYSFLIQDRIFGSVNFSSSDIWYSCGFFFINHLYSYLYYRNRVRQGEDFVNDAFINPYFRIVPMHLIIGLGAVVIIFLQVFGITSTLPVLVIFLFFKTGADITLHLRKHGTS